MKKRQFFKSCIALLMSTVLLGNEMGIVSIAEETVLLEEFQEKPAEPIEMGDTAPALLDGITVSANGSQEEQGASVSDSKDSELITDELSVDEDGILFDAIEDTVSVSDVKKNPEAELSVKKSGGDIYKVKLNWDVTEGAPVQLAIGMDSQVYACLPEDMQIKEDNIYLLPVKSAEGDSYVPMQKTTMTGNEDHILFVYTLGSVPVEFVVDAAQLADAQIHMITAEWYDTEKNEWVISDTRQLSQGTVVLESNAEGTAEAADPKQSTEAEAVIEDEMDDAAETEEVTEAEPEETIASRTEETTEAETEELTEVETEDITETEEATEAGTEDAPKTEEATVSETENTTETEELTEAETEEATEVGTEDVSETEELTEAESEDTFKPEEAPETEETTEAEPETEISAALVLMVEEDPETGSETENGFGRETASFNGFGAESGIAGNEAYFVAHKSWNPQERGSYSDGSVTARALPDGGQGAGENAGEDQGETSQTGPVDMGPYLTGTTAKLDEATNAIQVTLDYKINSSVLQNAQTNELIYTIPKNIFAKKAYSGSVMDGETVVGSYTISEDGEVRILFNEAYVSGTPADIKGRLSFWARTSADEVTDEGKLEIVFNDQFSITLDVNKDKFSDYDVTVDKSSSAPQLDREKNTMTSTYTVEMSSSRGTGVNLSFLDQLTDQKDKAAYSGITIEKIDAAGNTVPMDTSLLAVSEGTAQTDPKLEGTFPPLSAKEKYVIRYTVTREIREGEDRVQVKNSAIATNKYTTDTDYHENSVSLYDLSVDKSSPEAPVYDKESGVIKNQYTVNISTSLGTKGDVQVNDKLGFWPEMEYPHSYHVKTITKRKADGTTELLMVSSLYMDKDGNLTGELPRLEAGESYEISYEAEVSGLPSDQLCEFNLNNEFKAKDDASESKDWDDDWIEWAGKDYINWIEKKGYYDASTNKIKWEIVLNKDGYGNIDGLELSDILQQNGMPVPLDGTSFTLTEKTRVNKHYSAPFTYPETIKLPFTFKNGDLMKANTWSDEMKAIDTSHEFVITYETPVDLTNVTEFFAKYQNTAHLGDHQADTEVTVPRHELDKSFTGSTAVEGGHRLNWQTFLDIPESGLPKDGVYSDTISDSSGRQLNDKNWFTKEMLEELCVSVGGTVLRAGEAYAISCDGVNEAKEAFTKKPLNEVEAGAKISTYYITFLQPIQRADGASAVKITYSSFATSVSLAYNTGTYTENGFSISDSSSGKGNDGKLVRKTHEDGSSSFRKELEEIKDSSNGKYLLKYKLVVNENNSANGTITIRDTLSSGMSFCRQNWMNRNEDAAKDGVYILYRKYDEADSYPYSSTEEKIKREAYFKGAPGYISEQNAWGSGVQSAYTVNEDGNAVMTITIPQEAYQETINGKTVNHTMVIYYAAEINPGSMTQYECQFSNQVTVWDGEGKPDNSGMTDTVVGKCVGKSGSFNSNTDSAKYTVDINAKGQTLIPGETTSLTLKDTFEYDGNTVSDVNIRPGTLNLYKCEIKDGKLERTLCNEDLIHSQLKKENYSSKVILTAEVPDGAWYQLEYEYMLTYTQAALDKMNRDEDLKFSLKNDVQIEGIGSKGTSDSANTEVTESGSSATATKGYAEITLQKRDKDNRLLLLPGAEFELERFDGSGWVKIENNGQKFVTDENGIVKLGEKLDENKYRIAYNFAYRLREVKAPEGYKLLSGYRYFYVLENSGDTLIKPEDWDTNAEYKNNQLRVVNKTWLFADNEKQEEGKTQFVIRKEWKNPDGTAAELKDANGDPITSIGITLYKKPEGDNRDWGDWAGHLDLTAANNWSGTISNLDKYSQDGKLYNYYIKEDQVPQGWAVTYTHNGVVITDKTAIPGDTSDTLLQITNTSTEDTTSASVRKVWRKPDGTEYVSAPEKQAVVTLRRKYTVPIREGAQRNSGEMVTVTVEVIDKNHPQIWNPVTKTIQVPKGAEVKLYLESPGFNHFDDVAVYSPQVSAVHTWNTRNAGTASEERWVSCETSRFYVMQDTHITVGNEWCTYSVEEPNDTTFQLAPTGNHITVGQEKIDESFCMTAILSQQNGWSCTWPALEKNSTFGTPYTYFVEEAMTGYTTTISYGATSENMAATITNQRKDGLDTSISVKKKWEWSDGTEVGDQDSAGNLLPVVTLELYRSALAQASEGRLLPDDAELVDTAQVSKNSQWSHTWENLDKYVNNDKTAGQLYYYYVIEKKPGQSGYTFTTAQNGQGDNAAPQNNPVTVTNTLPYTHISVNKEWLGMDGTVKGTGIPSSVQVQLYRKGMHSGETDQPYGAPVTLGAGTGWSYTWEHLLQGTYYVKETTVPGFHASYQAGGAEAAMAEPSDAAVSSGTVTVKNQEVPVEITVTKDWYGVTPQEVKMQLYRSTEKPPNNTAGQGVLAPYGAELLEDQTVTLNGSAVTLNGSTVALNGNAAEGTSGGNGWTYTWTNLPAVNDSGQPYYYYVKEFLNGSQTGKWKTVYSYIFRDDGSISHVKVTNGTSETTDIVAEKKWEDVNGQEKTLSDWKVVLQLYREKADGSWEPYDPNGEGSGRKEIGYKKDPWNTWDVKKAEWTGLPVGRYYVEEVRMEGNGLDPARYTVTYKANPGAASTGSQGNGNPAEAGTSNDQGYINPADAAIQNGTIRITNTEGATELAVKKLWSDGAQNHSGEKVTMHLYSSTTNPEEARLQSNAREGKRVDVTWEDNGTKQISNVIIGNKAEIKLAYDSWKTVYPEQTKLVSSGGSEYGCELIEENNSPKYLKFIVDLTDNEQFALRVNASGWYPSPNDPNSGLHSITDISGTEVQFNTLILPDEKIEVDGSPKELSSQTNWSAHWKDLPLTDSNGNKLYYYIQEDQVPNCTAVYEYEKNADGISKVTVTNRPTSGNVEVQVKKLWKKANGTEFIPSDERSITVALLARDGYGRWVPFLDAQNKEVTAELSSANGWHHTFANLPNGEYCVQETEASGIPEGSYTVTYQYGTEPEKDNHTEASTIGNGTITVINTEVSTELEVQKVWEGDPGNAAWVQLYSSTTEPETVQQEGGGPYTIQVYTQGTETWHQPNYLKTETINSAAAKITLLYNNIWYMPDSNSSEAVTVTAINGTIRKLSPDGKPEIVTYNGAQYGSIVYEVTDITSNCSLRVIKSEKTFPSSALIEEIQVDPSNPKGEWVSGVNPLPSNGAQTVTPVGDKIKLSSANEWKHKWQLLPKYDEAGNRLYYYVKEQECPGYTTSYQHWYREDGSIEIVKVINKKKPEDNTLDIQVMKHWADTDDPAAEHYTVEVELWQHNPDGTESKASAPPGSTADGSAGNTPGTSTDHAIRYLNKDNGWCGGWTGLPKLPEGGYYFVKETQVTDAVGAEVPGYIPLYLNNKLTASGTAEITNWAATSISVEKKWLQADGTQKTEGIPEQIEVELYRWENTSFQLFDTISLGSSYSNTAGYTEGGWKYTWGSLPKGRYCVKEKQIIANGADVTSRYTVSYSKDGNNYSEEHLNAIQESGMLYIRNQEAVTGLRVEKKWMDSGGNEITAQNGLPSITVKLYRSTTQSTAPLQPDTDGAEETLIKPENAEEVASVTLDGSGLTPWSYRWTGLPKYDGSGTQYYYYVEEADGAQYKASYLYTFSEKDGEAQAIEQVTITNTKKSQGIVLPSTGSKYPWIFYGLGWTFLFAALIWMLLVLKKQNKKNNLGKGG